LLWSKKFIELQNEQQALKIRLKIHASSGSEYHTPIYNYEIAWENPLH
jgi:hypothetical protein